MVTTDLNLIRTFVTVYETGSVTAAAQVLHVTQPTVTHALNKLRRRLGDDLFVRSPVGVTPTAAARRAYPVLVDALNQIDDVLQASTTFDPTRRPTTFRIGMSDAGEVSVLPHIAAMLSHEAPRAALEVAPLNIDEVEGQLVRGELDAFVSSAVFESRRVSREVMFTERYVVLLAADHPRIGESVTAAALDAEPHVSVRGVTGHQDPAALQDARDVRVVVSVPRFTALPYLVAQDEAVAIVPRYIAEVFAAGHRVRHVPLPWELHPIDVAVYARHPHSRPPEQAWLVERMVTALSERYNEGQVTPNE